MGGMTGSGGASGAGGLANIWQNPWFQAGIGMLANNQGITGDAAFRNALGGGMTGLLRGQTIRSDIQQREQQRKLIEIQQQQAARTLEQQRRMAAAAPQLSAGLLSEDPATKQQAIQGILSMAPQALPAILSAQLTRKPTEQWETLSATESEALGFKPGAVAQRSLQTGQIRVPGAPLAVTNITGGEATQAAQAESVLQMGQELEQLITSGAVDPTGLSGLWTKFREQPTISAALANMVHGISQDESRAVQLTESLSQQLIAAMRGAQVGPEEEKRFQASLPVFGKPNFLTNLRTTLDNIAKLENKRRQLRKQPLIQTPTAQTPTQPLGPQQGAGEQVFEVQF